MYTEDFGQAGEGQKTNYRWVAKKRFANVLNVFKWLKLYYKNKLKGAQWKLFHVPDSTLPRFWSFAVTNCLQWPKSWASITSQLCQEIWRIKPPSWTAECMHLWLWYIIVKMSFWGGGWYQFTLTSCVTTLWVFSSVNR